MIPGTLFLLYLIALAFLCFGHFETMTQAPTEFLGIPTDKIVHFLMFLPFPFLLYLALKVDTRRWYHSLLLAAGLLVIGAAVAYATEYLQGLTDYRCYDILDFKADVTALSVSSCIVYITDISRHRRHVS